MRTHELYIDGSLINLGDDFDISLLYQSWFFQEITNITSNRSYTVKVPPTPNNLNAIGYSAYEDVDSDYQYKKHTADYYRNGYRLIDKGVAVVLNIDSNINIAITWGTIQNFSILSDAKLSVLDAGETLIYPVSGGFVSSTANFGRYAVDYGQGVDNLPYSKYSVNCKYIIERIRQQYGIILDLPNVDKYIIPVLNKNANEATNAGSVYRHSQSCVNWNDNVLIAQTITLQEPNSGAFGSHLDAYRYHCLVDCTLIVSYDIEVQSSSPTGTITLLGAIDLVSEPDVVVTNELTSSMANGNVGYILNFKGTFKVDGNDYGVTAGADTFYSVRLDIPNMSNTEISPNQRVDKWIQFKHRVDNVVDGMLLPILYNLPDMTIIDFIKVIMYLEGVFAYPNPINDNEVNFESVDALNQNKSQAIDWTKKLVNEMPAFSKPAYSEYNFNSLAQINKFLWNTDDSVTGDYSGQIAVGNETLETTKDLLTVPTFAGSDEKKSIAFVNIWRTADDGSISENDVTPRILFVEDRNGIGYGRFLKSGQSLNFSGIDGILARKYSGYRSIVYKPRYLKLNFVLNDIDLYKLQLDLPIYLQQYGHYYGIIKNQVKSNNLCQVELLRLNEAIATALTARWDDYVCERIILGKETILIVITHDLDNIYVFASKPVTSDVDVSISWVADFHTNPAENDTETTANIVLTIPTGETTASVGTDKGNNEILTSAEITDITPYEDSTYIYATSTVNTTVTNSGYQRFITLILSDGSSFNLGDAFLTYGAVTNSDLAIMSLNDYNARLDAFCDYIESNNTGLTIDRAAARVQNTNICPL